jgi:phospholipid-binding lipoprotein MlaA
VPAVGRITMLPLDSPDVHEESPADVLIDRSDAQKDIVVTARRRHVAGDPFQSVNAESFAMTQKIDAAFVGPVAMAYKDAVPSVAREGIRNFLYNLREPVVFLNYMLQLHPGKAGETVLRFVVNSTAGVAGVIDIAKRRPFRLPRRPNGFADTLGYYGVKNGPFFFFPLIGPTTLRDFAGGMADRFVLPLSIGRPFNRLSYSLPAGILGAVDHRAEFDERLHALHDGAADPYGNTRRFYLERRQAEIDALHSRRGTTEQHYVKPR